MQWFRKLVGRDGTGAPTDTGNSRRCGEAMFDRPFVMRDQFLSGDELHLLRSLTLAVGSDAIICPKVRVADVLAVLDATTHMDDCVAIDRKSVGFLLCDTETMRPRAAVSVLGGKDRLTQRLSGKVEQAFCAAGLPVVFVAPSECSVDDLRQQLLPLLATRDDARVSTPEPAVEAVPARPRRERRPTRKPAPTRDVAPVPRPMVSVA